MLESTVKKSPYSIKLLSLAIVAALSGMTSFAVNSAGDDDDELMMFIQLAPTKSAAVTAKPTPSRPFIAPVAKPAPVAITPVAPASVARATPAPAPILSAPVGQSRAVVPATTESPQSSAKRAKPGANWTLTPANPSTSGGFFNRPAAPVSSTAKGITTQVPAPAIQTPVTPSTPGGLFNRPTAPVSSTAPGITAQVPVPAIQTPVTPSTSGGFFNRPTAPVSSTTPGITAQVPAPAIQPPAAQTSLFRPVLQTAGQTSAASVKEPERATSTEAAQQGASGASYFRQVGSQAQPTLTPMPAVPKEVATPRRQVANAPSEAEIKILFADAVRQSLRISPRLSSSRSQAAAAESSVDEAKGQRWPQVDVTSNSKSLYFGSGSRNGGNKSDVPAVGINVATTLYDFGQTSNTIKTRQDQARAATVGIAAEEENTAWELSNAMIELNKQRLIISLSQDYVARMKELTSMLSGIVAVDKGRSSELTQAKGRLLSAQSSLDAAVSKARDTEIVIYRLLGDSQIALPAAAQWNLSMPILNAQLASLDRHPTILKARADAQASLSEAAAVRASGLPSLNWVVSKNTGEDEYGRSQAFQTGLQMSWGLFRGGSNSAAERAALSRAEANRHLVEEQHRDLEQRVRAANQDAGSLLERADLYQNLKVESDRIRLAFFEQWYHLGKRTLLDVLSAESDYYNNRVNEVSSRFDGYAAIMRSYASSGQLIGWLNSSGR